MSAPVKLVMLIDDQEIDLRLYDRVIKRTGLVEEVIAFTYADEALAYLKANPDRTVDLIILDINMPRMNGFEFLEAATEAFGPDFARIVVVMLTTSLIPADRVRAESFSAVKHFLSKPLTAQHIEDLAQDILRRKTEASQI